jgi:hypothetical protein
MNSPLPSIEPEGLLEGIKWRAVVLGAVVDIVLTGVAAMILLFWVAGPDAFSLDEEASAQALSAALASPQYLVSGLIAGLLATLIGAYVGARRAGRLHVRHGGWVAVLSTVFAFSLYLLPGAYSEPTPPFWYEALGIALVLPAGLLGGLFAALRDPAAAA